MTRTRWRVRAGASALCARAADERGSTLPLVLALGALALGLVLVAAAASSLYLERKRLFTLADGAALAGAEAFRLDAVDLSGGAPRPLLEPDDVRRDVLAYLAAAPTAGHEALVVEQATTVDGRSATVTLSAVWRPPVVASLFPDGVRISATATARSVFG